MNTTEEMTALDYVLSYYKEEYLLYLLADKKEVKEITAIEFLKVYEENSYDYFK